MKRNEEDRRMATLVNRMRRLFARDAGPFQRAIRRGVMGGRKVFWLMTGQRELSPADIRKLAAAVGVAP